MPIEIPYLAQVASVINKHVNALDGSAFSISPTPNDEFEILVHLMGLARLVEYNVRVSYEQIQKRQSALRCPAFGRANTTRSSKRPPQSLPKRTK
jgi:hypothetical protein